MLTVTINGRAHGPREVRDELSMNDFLREYLGMTLRCCAVPELRSDRR